MVFLVERFIFCSYMAYIDKTEISHDTHHSSSCFSAAKYVVNLDWNIPFFMLPMFAYLSSTELLRVNQFIYMPSRK